VVKERQFGYFVRCAGHPVSWRHLIASRVRRTSEDAYLFHFL